MFVLTVWSQFIPVNLWLPFGRPKQSAGIKTDYACRARSWLSPWTRSYPLLKNEPWRQRRGPCGEQPGMTATQNDVFREIHHIRSVFLSILSSVTLISKELSACYLNFIFPLMNGAFEAISTFFGYRNPWNRYIFQCFPPSQRHPPPPLKLKLILFHFIFSIAPDYNRSHLKLPFL